MDTATLDAERHESYQARVSHVVHRNGSLMATTDVALAASLTRWVLES